MTTLPRVGDFVRRHDPDRFLTTLFAPAETRPTLWTLYAFNHELARAREATREPMVAMIRLQWWREVVEGERKRHEVADPLRDAIEAGWLLEDDLLDLIEAREEEPPEETGEWAAFAQATAGSLAATAGRVLGADDLAPIRAAGAAFGAAGILRNRALNGEPYLPALAESGRTWLAQARAGRMPRRALAAALPAVLALRDFGRARPVRERGVGDKLAVTLAAARGRI